MDGTGKESLGFGEPADRVTRAAGTLVDFKLARRAFLRLPDEFAPVMGRAVYSLARVKDEQLHGLSISEKNMAINLARSEMNRLDSERF